jgi:integrase
MPRPKSDTPAYCLHKRSGRAYVTLNGRQHLLPGPHESEESRSAYDRLIAQWLSAGRTMPTPQAKPTVSTIIAAFWKHVESYYVDPDGEPTSEVENFRQALRPLRRLYGQSIAAEFGPMALKAVRADMIKPRQVADESGEEKIVHGWCRSNANKNTGRIKMLFRWAAENELVPPSVYHGLTAVAALKRHRTDARESEPVRPVDASIVEATLPHLPPPVAALVQLQMLCGARGGELFALRTCDIDRSKPVWRFRPTRHKTAWHGYERVIYFGPKAQEVLRPFLKLDLQAYLFTPADGVAWHNTRRPRKTPMTPSHRRRAEEAVGQELHPIYNRTSYARAIAGGTDAADRWAHGGRVCTDTERLIARWNPHRLRHSAGTRYRHEGDFEAAKIVLGHRSDSMTALYAERDERKAEAIVARIG